MTFGEAMVAAEQGKIVLCPETDTMYKFIEGRLYAKRVPDINWHTDNNYYSPEDLCIRRMAGKTYTVLV